MKIVIDARMYNESGIGRYIRNLINKLQKLDEENQYFVLHLSKEYESLTYNTNFYKIFINFKWYGVKEQIYLPKLLDSLRADLVHFPHFNVPIFYGGKFVVTIHDLIHQHFQMRRATTLNPLSYKLKRFAYTKVFKNAISKAQKILVPSNYVKDLLVREWDMDKDKVVVTPEAVDDKILKKSQISLKKWNIKQPYIFYVGNAHPHKNVEGLIKAFRRLRGKYPNLTLVLSGHDHYFWQRLRSENPFDGIVYTGYITDEELVALYKNARCFVMPSFEEGFGIPILEAMAIGCPVVSSNGGALPEVGGNAACYFDPNHLGDMEDSVEKVLNSEELRNELITKGQKRVKLFTWEKLAKQTLKIYEEIA